MAGAESDLGNKERALELYSNSIKLQQVNNTSYFNRATIFHEQKKYHQAKKDYREALKYDFNKMESYIRLSWIYSNENKTDSVNLILKEAIAIDSTYSDSYLYLADSYYQNKDYITGCQLYQKALELGNQRAEERFERRCK